MPNYRRCRVADGCYFFTVNLLERSPNDVLTRHVDVLRGTVAKVKQARPLHIDAWVVLPDHLHCVWTLPADDNDYRRHGEYCYINPVKHDYVPCVRDWPHSSFHRDVQNGLFPEDWAGGVEDIPSIE